MGACPATHLHFPRSSLNFRHQDTGGVREGLTIREVLTRRHQGRDPRSRKCRILRHFRDCKKAGKPAFDVRCTAVNVQLQWRRIFAPSRTLRPRATGIGGWVCGPSIGPFFRPVAEMGVFPCQSVQHCGTGTAYEFVGHRRLYSPVRRFAEKPAPRRAARFFLVLFLTRIRKRTKRKRKVKGE